MASALEWHAVSRPAAGETASGDAAFVAVAGGRALVAAVDGAGHGVEAARAAGAAVAVLQTHARESVVALVGRCHAALAGTRGAAIGVASIALDTGELTWLGVGNVEGRVVGGGGNGGVVSLLLHAGVVGHALPPVRAVSLELRRGDLLVLATDGVAAAFSDALATTGSPEAIAQRILREHDRGRDDALVLVARYLGVRP